MKSLQLCRSTGILAICGLLLTAVLAGCGGGGHATPVPTPIVVTLVTLKSSASAIDQSPQTATLTATVTNDSSNSGVTFSNPSCGAAACGNLTGVTAATATYNAPVLASGASPLTVTITATSVKDTTKSAGVTITVNPNPAISQPTAAQLTAAIGAAYSLSLGSGGTAPFTWTITSGTLPAGLSLNASASTGSPVISGTPTSAATDGTVTIKVTDADNQAAPVTVAITVPIVITTASLPQGEVSLAYNSPALTVQGGSGTLKASNPFSITSGTPENGLNFNQSTGAFSGTPTASGNPTLTLQVTDSLGATGSKQFTLTISAQVSVNQSGALAAGTLGTAYGPVTLTASNGVSPYSGWTVSSPALPTGLSLNSSTGVISGTPSAGGTFNFSVTVKDSLNVISVPANLSITITFTALAITTTSLPNATVGTAYDQAIQTSGGDGTAITFALANSTTLPAWASLNPSTGHITGTPAAGNVGTSAPFKISATQSGNTVISGNLTITVVASGVNNAELNGHYAFLLRGFDPSGNAVAFGGSFTADGTGKVGGGVMDINNASSSPSTDLTINQAPASFYSVGADNRGMLTLNTSAGTQTFDFAVGSISSGVASLGHIISRQNTSATNGSAISGVFKKQDTSAFTLTASNGDWAFLNEAKAVGGGRWVDAGRFTLNGGIVSNGIVDVNNAGTLLTDLALTGSFGSTDTTNGRVPFATTTTGGTVHSAVYIVSASEVLSMSVDSPTTYDPIKTGRSLRQSSAFCPTTGGCNFNNNALGNVVVYEQGGGTTQADVAVGTWIFSSMLGWVQGSLDENDGGTILKSSNNYFSFASYSVAANGRVTIAGVACLLYMVDHNYAFLIGTNSFVGAGAVEPQVGPIAVSSGGRAFGSGAPAVSGSGVASGVVTITATSSTTGNVTNATSDGNSIANGLHENVPIANDTFTIDATGRITFGSGTKVGYFINSTRRVVIDIQATDTTPTLIISDNQ